jgi:hypothetical protein
VWHRHSEALSATSLCSHCVKTMGYIMSGNLRLLKSIIAVKMIGSDFWSIVWPTKT